MVGHVNLREQVDLDFARTRRRATFRRFRARLQRSAGQGRLLCFEDARRRLGARGGRVHRGLKPVRLTDVVGSVGRCSAFDGGFLPSKASTGARWKAVDRAFHRAEELPPVSLYKVGDAYFVLDGNHRVSVARFHGAEWIDAFDRICSPAPFGAEACRDRRGSGDARRIAQGRTRRWKRRSTRIYRASGPPATPCRSSPGDER